MAERAGSGPEFRPDVDSVIDGIKKFVREGHLPKDPGDHEFFRELGKTWKQVYQRIKKEPDLIRGGLEAVTMHGLLKPMFFWRADEVMEMLRKPLNQWPKGPGRIELRWENDEPRKPDA